MTTPSLTETTGLSISLFKPTIDVSTPSYTPAGFLVDDLLGFKVTGYQHTLQAFGGYDSASLNINYNLVKAEDWIDRLGYHVEVYSPALVKIWEGFVNKIKINVGGLSVIRGPLTDIGNRAFVVYSTVDTTTTPPTVGNRDKTTSTTDVDSQNRYGVIEKAISVGGSTDTIADQIRDTWIAENAMPVTSQSFNNSSNSTPSVDVELLGYFHWLSLFTFNETTSGTREVTDAIKDVFNYEAASVNGLFSTDLAGIVTPASTVNVRRYVNKDDTALSRIKFLTAQGDGNNVRQLFGIYADRKAYYSAIPSNIEYQQQITDPKQQVKTYGGGEVKPWEILPGKWLEYTDFLVGRTTPSNFREDSRIEFIESVTYQMPWGFTHTGSKITKLAQALAKLGLAGASA